MNIDHTMPLTEEEINLYNTPRDIKMINPRMTILDMSNVKQDIFSLYDRGITILDPSKTTELIF